MIENYQCRIKKICDLLVTALRQYANKRSISDYNPEIIKSGIIKFDNTKIYIDTSCIEGINNISNGEIISYSKRPSRANMQPIESSVWFAKMKGANKALIVADDDVDLINTAILSTGFLGIKASQNMPLSLLFAIIISHEFQLQRDLNSVGTTMAGVNNETFLKIQIPMLDSEEVKVFDKKYGSFIKELSSLRRKINFLKNIKSELLRKYF